MHLARKIAAGIVILMVVAAVAVLLSAERLLNGIVRERILRDANGHHGTSLSLGTIHYRILSNRISCDSIRFRTSSNDNGNDTISVRVDELSCSDINWLRMLLGRGFSCGDLAMEGLRGHIALLEESEEPPDQGRDRDEQPRSSSSTKFLPVSIGRFSVNGGELSHSVRSHTGVSRDSVHRFALELRNVRLESLSGEGLSQAFASGRVECKAERVGFQIPGSVYRVGFASVLISESRSTIHVDSLRLAPAVSDAELFGPDYKGSTRYRATIGRLTARGVDLPGLFTGRQYTMRLVSISQPEVDIAVNKRSVGGSGKNASGERGTAPDSAEMPNEILTGMKARLHVDSVSVNGGNIKYTELYPYSAKPAVLRWSAVRLTATDVANERTHADSSAHFEVSGMFQDTARMSVSMSLPLARRGFSLTCHGIVDSLPLPSLNSFLEVSDRIRVVSGQADSIKFSVSAAQGRSTGTVRPRYRDLKIALLEKKSGRDDGLVQKVGTVLANAFKIRSDNTPEASDGVKEGPVHYVRKPDDPFFKFLWFSIRGGLGNVVGF